MFLKVVPHAKFVALRTWSHKLVVRQQHGFRKFLVVNCKQQKVEQQNQQINEHNDTLLFWQSFGSQLTVLEAQTLYQQLDLSLPFGVNNNLQEYTNFEVLQRLKQQSPTTVLLVGDSSGNYLAYGIDAVAVIETGLVARSGTKGIVARISKSRFQQVSQMLLSFGFHINIAEANNVRGQRKIIKVLTPLDNIYLTRGSDGRDTSETRTKHIACFDMSATSLDLYLCSGEQNVIDQHKSISVDSALSLLTSKVTVTPVLFRSIDLKESQYCIGEVSVDKLVKKMLKEQFKIKLNQIKYFEHSDVLEGFKSELKNVFNIDGVAYVRCGDSTARILDTNTAKQIGIAMNPLIPSLLRFLLGYKTSNQSIIGWMRYLLFNPPHPTVRRSIHNIAWQFVNQADVLPIYIVTSKPVKLSQIKGKLSVGLKNILQIKKMFVAVLDSFSLQWTRPVFADMVFVATFQVGIKLPSAKKLLRMCFSFIQNIDAFTHVKRRKALEGFDMHLHYQLRADKQLVQFLESFFWKQEQDIHSYVSPNFISKNINALDVARALFVRVLSDHLCLGEEVHECKNFRDFVTDQVPNFIHLRENYEDTEAAKIFKARRVEVQFAKKKKQIDVIVICQTKALDLAQEAYQYALEEANSAVKRAYCQIYDQIQQNLDYFHIVVQMNIIGETLRIHGEQALRMGWTTSQFVLPQGGQQLNDRLKIGSCWPYWKHISQEKVVCNYVDLGEVQVITGPNMGGKSTFMRTVITCALLGNCGLLVPATDAVIPYYDKIMYRCFIGDNPMENISAWGMECKQIQEIYDACGSQSLFAYDEFGKGTDPAAGAALLLGFIFKCSQKNMQGLFATHYSKEIAFYSNNLLKNTNVQYLCMESDQQQQWVLKKGISTDCKAFEVAAQCGLEDTSILEHAIQMYESTDDPQENMEGLEDIQMDLVQETAVIESSEEQQEDNSREIQEDPEESKYDRKVEKPVSFDVLIQEAMLVVEDCIAQERKRLDQQEMGNAFSQVVKPGVQQLGPRFASCRCAYIYLCETSTQKSGCTSVDYESTQCAIYVGQTTAILDRIKQHLNKKKRDGKIVVVWVVAVESGTVDVIKSVESELLKMFNKKNYRLLTTKDMNNKISSR